MSSCIHRRFNPLLEEWIMVSPNRLKRPWSGETTWAPNNCVDSSTESKCDKPTATNPLAPGALRPSGQRNEDYESVFVFENDFPALTPHAEPVNFMEFGKDDEDLFKAQQVKGLCRVVCFHPSSDVQLATMSVDEIQVIIQEWVKQFKELGQQYAWVQIFENKGAMVGCSNPHPHGQIWCTNYLPTQVAKKHETQMVYYKKHQSPMLFDYVQREIEKEKRIVISNDHWVVLVPFWATWPFETMLLPKRHIVRLNDVLEDERKSLAEIMKRLLIKYDNLFQCSFPYSMGWHGAPSGPFNGDFMQHWQLHALYLPPLVRSASVKKFIAGFELLAECQRDLLPETAAQMLRDADSDVHYSAK